MNELQKEFAKCVKGYQEARKNLENCVKFTRFSNNNLNIFDAKQLNLIISYGYRGSEPSNN